MDAEVPRLPTLALAASVAVAFADSSIVVLALPDLYGAFDTSIEGIAWVITSYNLVVAVAALALTPLTRRVTPARLAGAGLSLFAAASIGCGASQTLAMLIGCRCAQGLGAALLLAGSLPLLRRGEERTASRWIAAGTVGVAIGPALGGVLTELFDWRAIFLAQAPAAALALLATRRARNVPPAASAPIGRRAAVANAGLGLLFAALAGALFLAVLLVITVWGLSPIAAAGVVSALPAAALAVRALDRTESAAALAAGAALLALGLLALALLPARSGAPAACALALCGAGLGLALPTLTRAALGAAAGPRAGTLSVAARHAGLVLALVLVAPLLAGTLDRDGRRATLAGAAAILDANVPLSTKVPLALDLRDTIVTTPRGRLPDLDAVFARHGGGSAGELERLRATLVGTLTGVVTRGFRPAFALCALFAALALVPVAALGRGAGR